MTQASLERPKRDHDRASLAPWHNLDESREERGSRFDIRPPETAVSRSNRVTTKLDGQTVIPKGNSRRNGSEHDQPDDGSEGDGTDHEPHPTELYPKAARLTECEKNGKYRDPEQDP